jgi:hypothetical protein
VGACDKYSGVEQWWCLQQIYTKLAGFVIGGSNILSIPFGGSPLAATLLDHYLSGPDISPIRRRPIYLDPLYLLDDKQYMDQVNLKWFIHTFAMSVDLNFQNLVNRSPVAVSDPITYPAVARTTIRTYDNQMLVEAHIQGNTLTLALTRNMEMYDLYDWCEDNACKPEGTHPRGMLAGEFTSLEKAGWAKPFNVYSNWTQTNYYELRYNCGAPVSLGSARLLETKTKARPVVLPLTGQPGGLVPSLLYPQARVGDMLDNGYRPSPFFPADSRPY